MGLNKTFSEAVWNINIPWQRDDVNWDKHSWLDDICYYGISEGIIVSHKTYGDGVIVNVNKKLETIKIRFKTGVKEFGVSSQNEYQNAFKAGYLTIKW